MKLRTFLIVMLLLPAFALAGTYKWVDKNGNVHYSDTPPPEGAEEVELPKTTTFDAPDVPVRPRGRADSSDETPAPDYQLGFISPKQDQVFWATAGNIPVQLSLQPALRNSDQLLLYVDGALADPLAGLGTTLTGVVRGTHTLRAVITDADGKEIIATTPVTFHVKQQAVPQQTARPRGGK